MIAGFVILAIMAPLMVGGAFFMGVVTGHRLAQGQGPAGALTAAVQDVRQAVGAVTVGKASAVVATEMDEYEAELQRRNESIQKALAGYVRSE